MLQDPHVAAIYYEIDSDSPNISYENPAPLTFTNHLGEFRVTDGTVKVAPHDHFAEEADAHHAIYPFLRSWQIWSDIKSNPGSLRFKLLRSDVVDRAPTPSSEVRAICVPAIASVSVVGNATVHLTCKRYPEPPAHFMANPDVEVIFMRWRRFREGHEPLQSMAYFVVTFLERIAGSRSNASAMFSISSKVIRTMARLATERGAPSSARKAPTTNTFVELTARERRWLETAVRTIIEHLGEHSTPGAAKQLQMSDLPAL